MFQGMEYIYEVYKEKSFSKAAAALFISQPSLSANVKRVENRIGYPIFDRSTKPLQLTEVGKHYIQAVEKVMDIENNLENFILDLGNLKTGTLNVGGSNFFSSWILPPLIADFSGSWFAAILLLALHTLTPRNPLARLSALWWVGLLCSTICSRR